MVEFDPRDSRDPGDPRDSRAHAPAQVACCSEARELGRHRRAKAGSFVGSNLQHKGSTKPLTLSLWTCVWRSGRLSETECATLSDFPLFVAWHVTLGSEHVALAHELLHVRGKSSEIVVETCSRPGLDRRSCKVPAVHLGLI